MFIFSLIIIMTCAIIENTTAIAIILRVRILRQTPHNMLILNLCVVDLGVALFSMTFSLVSVFDDGRYLEEHKLLCKVTGFLANLFTFTHLMTIVVIAIDRVLIVTSFKALPDSHLRVFIMVATSWLIGTIIPLAPATELLSSMIYVSSTRHCTIKLNAVKFRIIFIIFIFLFVIPTLVACYSFVAYTLWRKGQMLKECQMSGRTRGKRACRVGAVEPSQNSESKPNSSNSVPEEDNGKRWDPSDVMTPTDEGVSHDESSGMVIDDDSLGMATDHADDDVLERHRAERPHVSFPDVPGDTAVEPGKVLFYNRKESLTSSVASSSWVASGQYNQKQRNATGKRTKKRKRSLKVRKKNYFIQRRVSIMGALLVLASGICWTPYVLVRTIDHSVNDAIGVFAMWLAYCITVIDPVIYAFMNQHARKELIRYKNILSRKISK
ncbi:alpha-2 adrenergic receptor-like [Lytechinus variegatus]|uniref:alpha-2 adrenergic receptor-like n=1 Tax=Lytechinus variegatus TaxID=7654 RepID=UPI001BB1A70E|nr:alpha-2 adrenergic receptor-like [Lytechinus variegatus]